MLCGGSKGDEALAALRMGCTSYEVKLSTGTRDMLASYGLGADLSVKVDFYGSINGHEIVQLTNNVRIIYVIHWEQLNRRIVINVVVNSF